MTDRGALNVRPISPADAFADRFQSARATQDGSTIFMERPETPLTGFINGFFKLSLGVAIFALVGVGSVFAFTAMQPRLEAAPVVVGSVAPDQTAELNALRSEVALLTEQSVAMRSELVLLTGRDGVLPKLIARLQEQRKVNGAHSNAIRQLYSTTGLIGASLPGLEETAATETVGSRPVQVTPVAAAQEDAPKRVVLIPEGGSEAQPSAEGGAGE